MALEKSIPALFPISNVSSPFSLSLSLSLSLPRPSSPFPSPTPFSSLPSYLPSSYLPSFLHSSRPIPSRPFLPFFFFLPIFVPNSDAFLSSAPAARFRRHWTCGGEERREDSMSAKNVEMSKGRKVRGSKGQKVERAKGRSKGRRTIERSERWKKRRKRWTSRRKVDERSADVGERYKGRRKARKDPKIG